MHELIETHKEALIALCEQYGVEKLEAFGSICTGTFDSDRSDVDLIATFGDTGAGYADRYLNLADALESLLVRRVDLLTPASIKSPIFRRSVDSCRQVIYEREGREKAA